MIGLVDVNGKNYTAIAVDNSNYPELEGTGIGVANNAGVADLFGFQLVDTDGKNYTAIHVVPLNDPNTNGTATIKTKVEI